MQMIGEQIPWGLQEEGEMGGAWWWKKVPVSEKW